MKFLKISSSIIIASYLIVTSAIADSIKSDLGAITLKLGDYNVRRWVAGNDPISGIAEIEYRDKSRLFWDIKPVVGFLSTTRDDWFVYAGLLKEIPLNDKFSLDLSIAPGYYNYGKDKKSVRLDNDLEFKSEIGVSYTLPIGDKIGVSFAHMSNASLGDHNPGVEIVTVNYTIPFNTF